MEITAVYVPLDGSERAERALGPATALAERSDAKLILLATLWPNERLDTVEHHLDACAAFADHPASPMLVVDRSPAEAICDAAAQPGALVCMTTRGRGAVRAALLGSEGEAALRASARPIVFVGPAFDPKWVLRAQPLVIAGVDGSGRSFAAARDAGEFAATLHGRVCVLEALRPSDIATARVPGWRCREARARRARPASIWQTRRLRGRARIRRRRRAGCRGGGAARRFHQRRQSRPHWHRPRRTRQRGDRHGAERSVPGPGERSRCAMACDRARELRE